MDTENNTEDTIPPPSDYVDDPLGTVWIDRFERLVKITAEYPKAAACVGIFVVLTVYSLGAKVGIPFI